MTRRSLVALAAAVATLVPATSAAGQSAPASWRLEQPAPPEGARFKVPLGQPGDMQFYAPNRGLLLVSGNETVPRGLFFYNGESWKQLSTVCGANGDSGRIAWAGPNEFWTITEPSSPRSGSATSLCRFKDGAVVASYSTPDESPDPIRPMTAASCASPSQCVFAGIGSSDPSGQRAGAYHLVWNGRDLVSTYAPQGRGVSDVVSAFGGFLETTFVGPQREERSAPDLGEPEDQPRLIHGYTAAGFRNESFVPAARQGVPAEGTELLAADAKGSEVWFAGGGAASGPSAPPSGVVSRPPIAVRIGSGGYEEVPLDPAAFGPQDRFADVSITPGFSSAWMAVQPFASRSSRTAKAKVALVNSDGSSSVQTLPSSGAGRGAAARIAFTAPGEGWMVTQAGWLFHYTDGTKYPVVDEPAFADPITFRPNEAAEQFVPDTPPEDDSRLNAPPVQVVQKPAKRKRIELKPLLGRVEVARRGLTVVVSFTMARRGRVQLQAKRTGRVYAKTRLTPFGKGRHVLKLTFEREQWPQALAFKIQDPKATKPKPGAGGNGTDDSVVTTFRTRG